MVRDIIVHDTRKHLWSLLMMKLAKLREFDSQHRTPRISNSITVDTGEFDIAAQNRTCLVNRCRDCSRCMSVKYCS